MERLARWATLLLALIASVLMVVSAVYRGPWLDDFATFRFADPAVPLGVAWHGLWPSETNPPLFYLIARAGVALGGVSLFARRMVNLLPLAGVLLWFWRSARRHPAQRHFLMLFWLVAASSSYFVWDFSSYRSYFFQYAASLVFVGAVVLDELEQRREVDWGALVCVPLLIGLHQVTALYAGVMIAWLVIRDGRRGNWTRAGWFGGVGVVCGLVLLDFTWNQQHQGGAVLGHVGWILPHGPLAALGLILGFLPRALGENWIALLGAAAALVVVPPQGAVRGLLGRLLAAAAAGTLLLLIANQVTPLIVDRYFAFLTVTLAAVVALLLAPLCARRVEVAWLLVAFAAVYLGLSFAQLLRDRRWDDGADIVARLVAQCPSTRVHAGALPPDPAEQTGLAFLAARRHLSLLQVGADQPGACPVLYWTEYLPPSRVDLARWHGDRVRAANARAKFGIAEELLAHTEAIKSQNGVILVVRQ